MAANARVGKAVLELRTDNTQYVAGLAQARGQLLQFQSETKKVTFRDMVSGMSAAGKEATASSKLIAGMSVAGRQAAAAQLESARASQAFTTRLQSLATGADLSTRALKTMGIALSVGAIFQAARSVGQFASHMQDLSAETGVGVERLQAFAYIGAGVGLTIDNLTDLMNQLTRRVANGDDSAVGALNKLGISTQKFIAMPADERLLALDAAFQRVTNSTDRTNTSIDLFGRSGPRALRLFNGELRTTVQQVERTGAVIEKDLIDKAARFDNFWSQAYVRVRAESVNTFDALIGYIDAAAARSAGLAGELINAVKAARELPGDVERLVSSVQNPLQPAAPATPRVATEAEQKDIERRAEEALDRRKEAERKYLEKVRNAQQESERSMRENQAVMRADIEAKELFQREMLAIVERQNAQNTRFAEEVTRAAQADVDAIKAFDDARQQARDEREKRLIETSEAENAALQRWGEQVQRRIDEIRERWKRFADEITFSLTNGLADMLVGLRSFKDGFVGIWQDIRRAVANILSQMLADLIEKYIKKAIVALAGAKLAEKFGLAGGSGGGGGGGGSQWAQLASGLLLNRGGQGGGPGGGPGQPPMVPWGKVGSAFMQYGAGAAAGGLVGYGVGSKTGSKSAGMITGGAAGAGVGFMFGGPIGAGIGFGVGLIGGWLGAKNAQKKANDIRDQFLTANWGGTVPVAGPRMAAWLTRATGEPGGGSLYAAFLKAKTVDGVRQVEQAIADLGSRMTPPKRVAMFNRGGFVPPGVTMPAILHGGRRGELILPLDRAQRSSDSPQTVVHHHHNTINVTGGLISPDTIREIHRKHIVPLNNDALIHNKGGTTTEVLRVIRGRA